MFISITRTSNPSIIFLFLFNLLVTNFALSSAEAGLNPSIAARIATLGNEGEGTLVTEQLMRKGDRLGTDLQRKLRRATAVATPYLEASVREAPWNDSHMGIDGPACFDVAPKLGLLFRAIGLPGYVAANGNHVFMMVEAPEVTLLIDPTIRQYFGQDSAPSWVPKIFVGTLSELKALYAKEPGLPLLPYQAIYFDPDWPSYRRDSKMLRRRDSFLYSPMNNEHAPLTEFLNANGMP